MADKILYRLTENHLTYGLVGRSITPAEFKELPYTDKPLFEKVNTALSDYKLLEIIDGSDIQIYLSE